jgi:hypothetical protein
VWITYTVEHLQVMARDLFGLRGVGDVLAELREDRARPCSCSVRAASRASSRRSPGMKRETERRTNA